MNSHIQSSEQLEMATHAEVTPAEKALLDQWGFTSEEMVSLLWLRQWYQIGGSDRVAMVRHLEFLRLLVKSGDLEL